MGKIAWRRPQNRAFAPSRCLARCRFQALNIYSPLIALLPQRNSKTTIFSVCISPPAGRRQWPFLGLAFAGRPCRTLLKTSPSARPKSRLPSPPAPPQRMRRRTGLTTLRRNRLARGPALPLVAPRRGSQRRRMPFGCRSLADSRNTVVRASAIVLCDAHVGHCLDLQLSGRSACKEIQRNS